jgi:nucleoside-diphosphate-sugar epimerase
MSKILVTGATGFVGRVLCQSLVKDGHTVRAAIRSAEKLSFLSEKIEFSVVGEIGPYTDWAKPLRGVDTVIHLAARVHVMNETAVNPLDAHRRINVDGTKKLADVAVEAKVRRIIYLSTIKVNGEKTDDAPFIEEDQPHPDDPYARSKWEAEQILHHIASEIGIGIVIIRSPLVYGPCVGGNFLRLLNWINKDIPLPLGSVRNKRSLIFVKNLVDAIIACIDHPNAEGNTFLVNDDHDISTPDLIRLIASAMGREPRLIPFSPFLLNAIGKFSGKDPEVERLIGSLCIDSSKIRKVLGWKPPFTVEEGIYETVKWYKSRN